VVINKSFCSNLESVLTDAFSKNVDREVRRYWCDGVSPAPLEGINSLETVMQTKQIVTYGWLARRDRLGEKHNKYEFRIKLGDNAFSAFIRNQNLISFIPTPNNSDWIVIDPIEQWIEIQLL
jgi:hypothetical protein